MFTHDDALDTQAAVRRANLRRALQLVFQAPGSQTRAGIARATGLTAATASSLVAELIDNRLIAEGEQAVSTGGKRATTLSIDAEHHLILVLVVQPTSAYLLAVGVQIPGTTDGRTVLESVQLEWHEVPLADRFESITGVPVLLVNDVDAEAIAEAGLDAAPSGYRLFIHSGGGIGAAVTLDGELAPGPRERAGEIGHVQVGFGDAARPCRCGRRGCLESAAAMGPMLGEEFSDALDVPAVRALVARADQTLIDDGARALARAIKLIGALLDPIEVVIGGPATELGPRFLERVRAESGYPARGTADVPIRYADPRVAPSAGAAQAALTAVLGVRWSPEQLRAGGPRP